MENIIEVQNVSKQFQFRKNRGGTLLREEMAAWMRFKREKRSMFLALDDISFNIEQGESVGIIGNNGAGKSTLLKILSRITAPTKGKVTIRGAVSSILEVGTGFHQELTGRENIFFSGALRGLSTKYIRSKLDEIVDFSGVEHYLHMPFKHYSSGMQVRLAFAILSHIDSDIFITDEVLAVGDAAFQKKSMQKIEEIFNQGKTIIFVSHQQSMVSSLTNRCLLLEEGKLIADGPTNEVIRERFQREEAFKTVYQNEQDPAPSQYAKLVCAGITNIDDSATDGELLVSGPYKIFMEFEILQNSGYQVEPVLQVKAPEGYLLFSSSFREFKGVPVKGQKVRVECNIPGNFLNVGEYYISWSLISRYPIQLEHFIHEKCLSFGIKRGGEEFFNFYGDYTGVVSPKLEWKACDS